MIDLIVCKVTGKEYNSLRGFLNHLRTLKMTSKEYYDIYIKESNEGICYCGEETKFDNFKYNKFCSDVCANKSENKRKILSEKFLGPDGEERLKSFAEKRKGIDPNLQKRRQTIKMKCQEIGISENEYYSNHSKKAFNSLTEEQIKERNIKSMETKLSSGKVGGRSYYKEYFLFDQKIMVQGYEPIALDYLCSNYEQYEICAGGKPFCVKYFSTESNSYKMYFPDIQLKKLNLFVEVKSNYTYEKNKQNVHDKMLGCLENGYSVVLLILTGKEKRNLKLDGYKKLLDWAISSQASKSKPTWYRYDEGSTTILKGVESNDSKCRDSYLKECDIVWSSMKVEAA